uniref:SNCAIP n=1 Tax=Nothoprocta perdicaria TaxID=30464 RepID=A0A8C7EI38_NOTPE
MEAPEYLDLDEIDFSDDISYSITSLKTIPELCRRCDSQNEDRSEWSAGVCSVDGERNRSYCRIKLLERSPKPYSLCRLLWSGMVFIQFLQIDMHNNFN